MSILLSLAIIFFKIGLFAFGGGTAMLPLIYQSIYELDVMDASDFSDMVALSQVTPGPVAVNAATYVGIQCAGVPGARREMSAPRSSTGRGCTVRPAPRNAVRAPM